MPHERKLFDYISVSLGRVFGTDLPGYGAKYATFFGTLQEFSLIQKRSY